ncbi:hypothetical protein BaRGS_00034963 [Batillaria attramentaria]|uniref:Uncharacterized protein n=1 Tax=Batillaria attramentaria TaxID=370345 RepID=A0ABD0JFX1_9CAEN
MSELREIKQYVQGFDARMTAVENSVQANSDIIHDLRDENASLKEKVEGLEKAVEKQEIYSRRENFKLYGIPEQPREDFNACKQAVVDLLNTCSQDDSWLAADLVRAHRVGAARDGESRNSNNPRPVIVRMVSWEDKMAIVRNRSLRAELRRRNINIGDDLTLRQSQQLRDLRSEGKSGFFRGARLIITENNRFADDDTMRGVAGGSGGGGGSEERGSVPDPVQHASPSTHPHRAQGVVNDGVSRSPRSSPSSSSSSLSAAGDVAVGDADVNHASTAQGVSPTWISPSMRGRGRGLCGAGNLQRDGPAKGGNRPATRASVRQNERRQGQTRLSSSWSDASHRK